MRKILVLLMAIFIVTGCQSKKYIKGTTIEDNEENRKIVKLVDTYNEHIKKMEVDKLYKMADSSYFDTAGTVDNKDDFGYIQLKDILKKRFKHIKDIYQKIDIRNIVYQDDKIFVDYKFEARFLMEIQEKKKWHTIKDMNQLVLIKKGDHYKIIKGM